MEIVGIVGFTNILCPNHGNCRACAAGSAVLRSLQGLLLCEFRNGLCGLLGLAGSLALQVLERALRFFGLARSLALQVLKRAVLRGLQGPLLCKSWNGLAELLAALLDVVVVERHVFDFQAARESASFLCILRNYLWTSSHGGVGGFASCQEGRCAHSDRCLPACARPSLHQGCQWWPFPIFLQVAANYVYFCFTFLSMQGSV